MSSPAPTSPSQTTWLGLGLGLGSGLGLELGLGLGLGPGLVIPNDLAVPDDSFDAGWVGWRRRLVAPLRRGPTRVEGGCQGARLVVPLRKQVEAVASAQLG
eukprot:scaffold13388_cov51-Phaeocystis_antarctica.AAC.1